MNVVRPPGLRAPLEGVLVAALVALAATSWLAGVREQLSRTPGQGFDPSEELPALLEQGRGRPLALALALVALASLAACAHLLSRAARALRVALAGRPLTVGTVLAVAHAWWGERTATLDLRPTIVAFWGAFLGTKLLGVLAVMVLLRGPEGQSVDPAAQLRAGVAAQALVLALLLFVLWRTGGPAALRGVGLTGDGLRHEALRGLRAWLAVLPLYVVVVAAWLRVGEALGIPPEGHPLVETLAREGPRLAVLVFVLAAVIAPVYEELVFRALLVPALARVAGTLGGVLLAAVVFGAMHPGFASLLPITTMGLVFAALWATSPHRSLVGSIVAHALFNGSQVLILVSVQAS